MIGRYGRKAKLEQSGKVVSRIDESIAMLQEKLATGELIYGEYKCPFIDTGRFIFCFHRPSSDDTAKRWF